MSHDNTMSESDAAAYLGVTARTVRNYIKKGLLSKVREGRSTRIPVEDVVTLREDRESSSPVVSRSELLQHKARIRRLESNMEVVLHMLDAKDAPLGINREYSKGLYAMAQENLKGGWSTESIFPWLDVFDRLSEDDLETMSGATEDPHPWRIFLRLCNAMIAHVVGQDDYATSLEMQSLHRKLASSRRRLRVSSFIYGEMQGAVSKEITGIVGTKTTADEIFRKILKR